MKKLLGILALAISVGACQQSAPHIPVAAARRHPAAVALPDSLAAFKKYDVSALFRMRSAADDTLAFQPQAGCFGPEGYLVEMAFLKVRRDSLQPNVYWVQGKRRFKKVITSFSGNVRFDRLVKQRKYLVDSSEFMGYGDYTYYKMLPAYTATGTFVLREKASQPGAGILQGMVALDFSSEANGSVNRQCLTLNTPTQLGELKFVGTWCNVAGIQIQPVIWLGDFISYRGVGALPDLLVTNVGGRGSHLKPKYAHLGWNEAWKNDEWWATSPKPKVSL